jgi:hypothetical protein
MAKSIADIDGFITLLRVACEDQKINAQLARLLAMPDEQRRGFVHAWVTDMIVARAPHDFIEAIGCLMDDRVAEKTYEVIFQCRRDGRAG